MADRIAVMNQRRGAADRHARPRSTTGRARMFVAGFIGSPAMNFLDCAGRSPQAAPAVRVNGETEIAMPRAAGRLRQEPARARRAARAYPAAHDAAACAASVFGVEYMGARQSSPSTPRRPAPRCGLPNDIRVQPRRDGGPRLPARRAGPVRPRHRAGAAPRELFAGDAAMAEVSARGRHASASARSPRVAADLTLASDGELHGPARPHRRRQDHDAAPGRRAGTAGRGPGHGSAAAT